MRPISLSSLATTILISTAPKNSAIDSGNFSNNSRLSNISSASSSRIDSSDLVQIQSKTILCKTMLDQCTNNFNSCYASCIDILPTAPELCESGCSSQSDQCFSDAEQACFDQESSTSAPTQSPEAQFHPIDNLNLSPQIINAGNKINSPTMTSTKSPTSEIKTNSPTQAPTPAATTTNSAQSLRNTGVNLATIASVLSVAATMRMV